MKRFTEDFFLSCMKANIFTGAVQFINIYNYYDVKTKRLLYRVGSMQGHGIIHGKDMKSKLYSRPSFNNKLVSGLWTSLYEPLDVSVLHSSNTERTLSLVFRAGHTSDPNKLIIATLI